MAKRRYSIWFWLNVFRLAIRVNLSACKHLIFFVCSFFIDFTQFCHFYVIFDNTQHATNDWKPMAWYFSFKRWILIFDQEFRKLCNNFHGKRETIIHFTFKITIKKTSQIQYTNIALWPNLDFCFIFCIVFFVVVVVVIALFIQLFHNIAFHWLWCSCDVCRFLSIIFIWFCVVFFSPFILNI